LSSVLVVAPQKQIRGGLQDFGARVGATAAAEAFHSRAQSEQFAAVGQWVERMERTRLEEPRRIAFAEEALRLRFPKDRHRRMNPALLLEARRSEDAGDDVWRVYNVIQENVIRGGLAGRSASNRSMRSRPIKSVKRDVELNTDLWKLATTLVA
jgi:hypothetical protein